MNEKLIRKARITFRRSNDLCKDFDTIVTSVTRLAFLSRIFVLLGLTLSLVYLARRKFFGRNYCKLALS